METTMKLTRNELERLAVQFRNAPCSPSHSSADTWNAIAEVGGRTAITYGVWLATPIRSRWKKRDLGLDIASALDEAASRLPN
jgi:hypothetical protein